jgi:hypothetical protein
MKDKGAGLDSEHKSAEREAFENRIRLDWSSTLE